MKDLWKAVTAWYHTGKFDWKRKAKPVPRHKKDRNATHV